MNPFAMFKTDDKIETEVGVIIDYGDFRVRIARAGGSNKKYAKLVRELFKPYERQMDNNCMDQDVARSLMATAYSQTIVLGFEVKGEKGFVPGIPQEDGSVAPFTPANVKAILLQLPDFFADIQDQANKMALFRAQELEAEAKK